MIPRGVLLSVNKLSNPVWLWARRTSAMNLRLSRGQINDAYSQQVKYISLDQRRVKQKQSLQKSKLLCKQTDQSCNEGTVEEKKL